MRLELCSIPLATPLTTDAMLAHDLYHNAMNARNTTYMSIVDGALILRLGPVAVCATPNLTIYLRCSVSTSTARGASPHLHEFTRNSAVSSRG